MCTTDSALLVDGVTRWTKVSTSGAVLFGIALVFTFNALVSMMQSIASEDTLIRCKVWCSGPAASHATCGKSSGC